MNPKKRVHQTFALVVVRLLLRAVLATSSIGSCAEAQPLPPVDVVCEHDSADCRDAAGRVRSEVVSHTALTDATGEKDLPAPEPLPKVIVGKSDANGDIVLQRSRPAFAYPSAEMPVAPEAFAAAAGVGRSLRVGAIGAAGGCMLACASRSGVPRPFARRPVIRLARRELRPS